MARVEYIGKQPLHLGRGIARGLAWEGPGDIVTCADDIAEKICGFHPDVYRMAPDVPQADGSRVPPPGPVKAEGATEPPNPNRLIGSYKIVEGGKEKPVEHAGVMAIRSHMIKKLGLTLRKKMSKAELLSVLEECLQAKVPPAKDPDPDEE